MIFGNEFLRLSPLAFYQQFDIFPFSLISISTPYNPGIAYRPVAVHGTFKGHFCSFSLRFCPCHCRQESSCPSFPYFIRMPKLAGKFPDIRAVVIRESFVRDEQKRRRTKP